MTRRFSSILFAAPLALGLVSCADDASEDALEVQAQLIDAAVASTDGGTPAGDAATAAPFVLTSPAVKPGVRIEDKYRCNGPSPELAWTPGPAGTKSYALLLQDEVNKFYHWAIYDVPATESGLQSNVPRGAAVDAPKGAKQVPNILRAVGYTGPCASAAENVRKDRPYTFTLYALDVASLPGVTPQSTPANVLRAVEAHDLASTKLNIISYGP